MTTVNLPAIALSQQDRDDLARAKRQLEQPSFITQMSEKIGSPIEHTLQRLPNVVHRLIDTVSNAVIRAILFGAVKSLDPTFNIQLSPRMSRLLVTGGGALSGFAGPLTMLAELPVTTSLILRSIADIAREQGEDLESAETRLACIEVFALGGRSTEDDAAKTGYYSLRLALGLQLSQLFGRTWSFGSNPITKGIVKLIASRFTHAVTRKIALQLVPIASAISGAAVNYAFMQHYQDTARAHFTVRRLERQYGADFIKSEYDRL